MNTNEKIEILRDARVINAILKRVQKLNNCEGALFAHPDYKYIMNECPKDSTDFKIEYKGNEYKNMYFSGCFYDFVVKIIK